jgi:mono/diheme cytochrome c family protein
VHGVGEGRHPELADDAQAIARTSAIDIDDFARSRHVSIRFASVIAHAFAALALTALAGLALGEEEQQASPLTPLPKYRQECAVCHIAYPPGMLPVDSWRRILNNLDHHFGTNASLDQASVKQLESWLTAHAANAGRAASAPPEDRITRSRWFMATHDEVPASTSRLPAVKSASNCAACHTRADQGNFDERYIRIPR